MSSQLQDPWSEYCHTERYRTKVHQRPFKQLAHHNGVLDLDGKLLAIITSEIDPSRLIGIRVPIDILNNAFDAPAEFFFVLSCSLRLIDADISIRGLVVRVFMG